MIFVVAEVFRENKMNPQPDPIIGHLFAGIVLFLIVFFAVKSYLENQNKPFSCDLFTIGYMENAQNTVIVNQMPINNFESQQLYIDCIDTLIALGYKKSEAKKRAKHIFQTKNPQPQTVQEFLDIILKR